MDQPGVTHGSGRESRYYTALGRASDFILRCKDCKALRLLSFIQAHGCCECGNKRFVEITTLTEAEMESLTNGSIDFPYRAEFLAEFQGHV